MDNIKGNCEHCGFFYQGLVKLVRGLFHPQIKCPSCSEITLNFDSANVVDKLERAQGQKVDYVKSKLAIA